MNQPVAGRPAIRAPWHCSNSSLTVVAVAGLLILAGPEPGQAQNPDHGWDLAIGAGPSFTTGHFGDLALRDPAPTMMLGLTYWLSPRAGIQVRGQWERWPGTEEVEFSGPAQTPFVKGAPDMTLYHVAAAGVVNVPVSFSRLDVVVNVGAGGSTWDSEPVLHLGDVIDFTHTSPALSGGLRVGYEIDSQLTAFARGQAYLVLTEEEETQTLIRTDRSEPQRGFESMWTLPATVGLEIAF